MFRSESRARLRVRFLAVLTSGDVEERRRGGGWRRSRRSSPGTTLHIANRTGFQSERHRGLQCLKPSFFYDMFGMTGIAGKWRDPEGCAGRYVAPYGCEKPHSRGPRSPPSFASYLGGGSARNVAQTSRQPRRTLGTSSRRTPSALSVLAVAAGQPMRINGPLPCPGFQRSTCTTVRPLTRITSGIAVRNNAAAFSGYRFTGCHGIVALRISISASLTPC